MNGNFDKAVALKYISSMTAPFVLARGRQRQAEKIISLAEKHGIAVVNDPDLAESLFILDMGRMIPESLFEIVAEILAFVYLVEVKKHD